MTTVAHEYSAGATIATIAADTTVTAVTTSTDASCSTTSATIAGVLGTILGAIATHTGAAAVPTCITTVTTVSAVTAVAPEDSSVATVAHLTERAGSVARGESVADQHSGGRSLGGAIAEEDVDAIPGLLTNLLDYVIHASFACRTRFFP